MRRDTFKLLVLAGIVAFAVLYGMELSSRGIEDVNGSWNSSERGFEPDSQAGTDDEAWPTPTAETGKRTSERGEADRSTASEDDIYYIWDEDPYDIPRNDRKPIVDRVSGATADALHDLSKSGIKFVVSLFDKVTG